MLEAVTSHFDLWTSVLHTKTSGGRGSNGKKEAYGLKKLRELILDLAVQGKLVSQDLNDEPAQELLKRITHESLESVRKGKDQRETSQPDIPENEFPYRLPNGWEWVRLGEILSISSGDGLTNSKMNSDGTIPVYGGNGITGYHDKENVTKPTLVIGRVGFYCGSVHITPNYAWITDNAFITTFSEEHLYLGYLYWLLKATNLKENESATAQPVISGRKIYPIVVGLPPLAEQHRIVAKVDELMALCDQLEEQQTSSIEAHKTLVKTLLATLTRTKSQQELNEAWTRIANHFDTLFTTEHSIEQLKQTILQLAVMGKLVPQQPDEETAQILIGKIFSKKKVSVCNGKRESAMAVVDPKEFPFDCPTTWRWTRIGTIAASTDYGMSTKTFDDPDGIPVIKMGDISNGQVILGGQKTTEANAVGLPELFLDKNDLLYNRTNSAELVGKTGLFDGPPNKYTFASYLIRIRQVEGLGAPKYLNYWMNTFEFRRSQVEPHLKQQCGQANVNGTIMRNMLVPLPPEMEQHRIVAKVDELMALCDTLKTRIREAQTTQVQLADAVVEKALNA